MASNSDSLFFILSYIKRHPDDLVKAIPAYDNVIRLFISDKVKVSDADKTTIAQEHSGKMKILNN